MRLCVDCGAELPVRMGRGRPRLYCAPCHAIRQREYQRAWRKANPEKVREIGRAFRARNPTYARDYYAANLAKPQLTRSCDECGTTFTTARDDQRFCGWDCGHAWHRRQSQQSWNDRRRANYQKRRARKRAASADKILLSEVRERDKDRCGICGCKVNGEVYPHPRSASLDHVVPLCEGGEHSLANVRLTHLGCNVTRGARGGGEQLRVV